MLAMSGVALSFTHCLPRRLLPTPCSGVFDFFILLLAWRGRLPGLGSAGRQMRAFPSFSLVGTSLTFNLAPVFGFFFVAYLRCHLPQESVFPLPFSIFFSCLMGWPSGRAPVPPLYMLFAFSFGAAALDAHLAFWRAAARCHHHVPSLGCAPFDGCP